MQTIGERPQERHARHRKTPPHPSGFTWQLGAAVAAGLALAALYEVATRLLPM